MSLKHILLGVLQQPKSGYDVKKLVDEVFNNFWVADLAQIYRQLKNLTEQGLLTVNDADSNIGPNKKIYQTTSQGQKELLQWLSNGPITKTEKISFLAQTYFLGLLDNDEDRLLFFNKLLDHFSNWHQMMLLIQEEFKAECKQYPHDLADDMFYPNLVLTLGIDKLNATVKWAKNSIQLIKARKDGVSSST